MKPQILYKNHDNNDCNILQNIVRYLFATYNIDIRPIAIIERNIPKSINILPTIIINNTTIPGINNIANYYEQMFNISDIITKSTLFSNLNPDYRITDNSTQRNIKFI